MFLILSWSWLTCNHAHAHDPINMADFTVNNRPVDRTGRMDASAALADAVMAENDRNKAHDPGCIYIPAGIYRISQKPPMFVDNGCVRGDGPAQSIILLDESFAGDLFSWSEAWTPATKGATITGLKIVGSKAAKHQQNAMVFYDRNDEVFIDRVNVEDMNGRALYSGVTKNTVEAFMRGSTISNLRLTNDGGPDAPVMEFNSQGKGRVDATNQIHITQIDIYASGGPSFVIRNNGTGTVRGFNISQMNVEGRENGSAKADLVDIGDRVMTGAVANIDFSQLQLSDPYEGFAAIRLTAPLNGAPPYLIKVVGAIGGGLAHGEGLRIDAGRTSSFTFSDIHTDGTNVVIGPHVGGILLDGQGLERNWTYSIDKTSENGLSMPVTETVSPSSLGAKSHQ